MDTEQHKKITWANEENVRIIFNSRSLKQAIKSCDFEKIVLILESNGYEICTFFTKTSKSAFNKDGKSVEHAWLKHFAFKIHKDTVNSPGYSENQFKRDLFKKILLKLLTCINKEILTKDFIKRHNFTEIVKGDIEEVMNEYDIKISKETDSLSSHSFESSDKYTQENLGEDNNV
mmetsp:Transcript_18899/g.17146  ORF Transcript_18899/g.17146 Transcript_18899/m.17146 type:complete len:175 (+) Transcript_18899:148-672(+)